MTVLLALRDAADGATESKRDSGTATSHGVSPGVWNDYGTDRQPWTTDLRVPDHRYGDGDTIGSFEAIHLGGHTAGSSALVDEDRGVLIAGDTVAGSDWRGLPAGYLLNPPEYFSDDVTTAESSLERLLEYELDAALVFHGSSVTEDAHDKPDRFVNFPGRGR